MENLTSMTNNRRAPTLLSHLTEELIVHQKTQRISELEQWCGDKLFNM